MAPRAHLSSRQKFWKAGVALCFQIHLHGCNAQQIKGRALFRQALVWSGLQGNHQHGECHSTPPCWALNISFCLKTSTFRMACWSCIMAIHSECKAWRTPSRHTLSQQARTDRPCGMLQKFRIHHRIVHCRKHTSIETIASCSTRPCYIPCASL